MSLIKSNAVQIGQSGTATQNFTLAVPSSPDGTIKLARGNSGATTQDVISVDASGNFDGLVKATGSTTAHSLANRFADVVNVKDFGAVGDGNLSNATTNLTAFTNAMAAGKVVYVPSGNYRFSTTGVVIETTMNGQVIVGDGLDASLLNCLTIHIKHTHCRVEGLKLLGAQSNTPSYGVLVDDGRSETERTSSQSLRKNAVVDKCYIINKTYGIAFTDTGSFDAVTNSYINQNSYGIWFANDVSSATGTLNPLVYDRGDKLINNNIIYDNDIAGIWAKCVGAVLINNNKIIGNGTNLLVSSDITGGRNEKVQGLYMSNNSIENATANRVLNIVSVADNGSGNARVTVNSNHLLPETHAYLVTISGSVNYNGNHEATWVSNTAFDLDTAFIADNTGIAVLLGWDMHCVDTGAAGTYGNFNIQGGDINQFNIESGANFRLDNINVKYQRRFGVNVNHMTEFAYTHGTDRLANNIDIPPSGNYLPLQLTGQYSKVDGSVDYTIGQFTFPSQPQLSNNPNTLDEYSEGTWNAVFQTTNVDLTVTMENLGCHYTKIGRLVNLTCAIRTDAVSGGTGNVVISGIPTNLIPKYRCGAAISTVTGWATQAPDFVSAEANASVFDLKYRSSTTTDAAIPVANLDNGINKNLVIFSITYVGT